MWSFFTRARSQGAPAPEHPAQTVLRDFEALDHSKREATAQQLSLLWSWFVEEFGGPRPFLETPPSEQQAYLNRLDRIGEQSERLKDTELGRYYYSVAILRHFLEALRTGDTSPAAIALSKRLVLLTEWGRKLQPDTRAA